MTARAGLCSAIIRPEKCSGFIFRCCPYALHKPLTCVANLYSNQLKPLCDGLFSLTGPSAVVIKGPSFLPAA